MINALDEIVKTKYTIKINGVGIKIMPIDAESYKIFIKCQSKYWNTKTHREIPQYANCMTWGYTRKYWFRPMVNQDMLVKIARNLEKLH